jgi:hypothetical protein
MRVEWVWPGPGSDARRNAPRRAVRHAVRRREQNQLKDVLRRLNVNPSDEEVPHTHSCAVLGGEGGVIDPRDGPP